MGVSLSMELILSKLCEFSVKYWFCVGCGGFEEGSKKDRRGIEEGAILGRCGERVMAVVEKPTGQKSAGLTLRARWLLVAMTWQQTEQKKNGGKKKKNGVAHFI